MTPSKNVLKTQGSPTASNRSDLLANDGMSMILLLIILAISGIAMMGIMSMGNIQRRSQPQSFIPAQIITIRGNILNILKNDPAWDKTASDSANSALHFCYKNPLAPSACNNAPPGLPLIKIDGADGNTIYYGNVGGTPTRGFATDGSNCNTFPSEDCPIAMEVLWSCVPSSGTTGCDQASNYSNMQFQITTYYKPIRLSTGQLSPDAIILDASKYFVAPVLRTGPNTAYNFP